MSDWKPMDVIPIKQNKDGGPTTRCHACRDSGAVLARKKDGPRGAPYAFMCACSAADLNRRRYPHWNVGKITEWELAEI